MTSNSDSKPVWMPSGRSPRRVALRPHAPRLRPCRPDRRVLELPGGSHLRRTPDPTIWTVVGGVGLAQMALLVNGASSQTVWIGSTSRRSRPESPHTRKDGNRNPRGRLPPPGVPPFFLRADAIGAASDRSRTQSEGRSVTFRSRSSFVAAFPAATTDPTARLASPRVAKRARSSHPALGMAALDRVVRR